MVHKKANQLFLVEFLQKCLQIFLQHTELEASYFSLLRSILLTRRFYHIKYTEIQSRLFAKTAEKLFVKVIYIECDSKFQKETVEKKGQHKLGPPSN